MLPYETTADYNAIIILNKCMAGRPDPRVESFIDNVPEKEKIILLTTGRLDSWKPDSPAVDAITSASVITQSTIIGITACSAGKCNNFRCTSIEVEVW